MNSSVLRCLVRPLTGLALVAAMVGVPAAAASAAHTENYYCDWDSGYGCESYGYSGYPTDHGRDYGHSYDGYYHHGRHHRY
ncbi:MAG TPA: hypothetical protein VGJ14_03770 [Sporichthyaceae bacterium]